MRFAVILMETILLVKRKLCREDYRCWEIRWDEEVRISVMFDPQFTSLSDRMVFSIERLAIFRM